MNKMMILATASALTLAGCDKAAETPAKPNAAPDYILAALPEYGVLPNPKRVVRRKMLWGGGGVALGLAVGIGLAVGLGLTATNNVNVLEPRF